MAAHAPIRFISKDRSQFYQTLTARVDAYFQKNGIAKHANWRVVVKSIILIATYIIPFFLIITLQPAFGWALLMWAVMGVAMAGIGMSVMHDANHGAYTATPWLNTLIGECSLTMLGGSAFNWKMQHNNLHHTFTNIVHYDEDIADKGPLRLSPHTDIKNIHRFQWAYALMIYSLVTLYWVTAKDFMQFARYKRNGVNKNPDSKNRLEFIRMVAIKIIYFSFFAGLPLAFGLPFWEVLVGFLVMHLVGGIILTVVFQLAHTVEETTFPLPNEQGIIQNEWAIHQMETTVNFSRRNRLLSWYVGGLNFQVEHHLFPKICHVHYPKIAEIVQNTAQEFNVPYLEHKSFGHALRSHFATLQRLGKLPDLNEVIG
jgi:linoleoyl-CoA desaturase